MRVAKNAVFYALAGVAVSLLAFVQVKILTQALSKRDVGLYFGLSGTVLFVAEFLKLGIPQILPRFVPLYEAKGENLLARRLISILLLGYGLLLGIAGGIVWGLSRWVFPKSAFWHILPWAFLAFGLLAFLQTVSVGLVAQRRIRIAALLTFLAQLGFTLLLWVHRHRLTLGLVFGDLLVASGLMTGMGVLLLKPAWPKRWAPEPEFWHFSRYAAMSTVFAPVYHYFDYVVLAGLTSYPSLALFGVARRIENFLRRLLWLPLETFAPELSFQSRDPGVAKEMASLLIRSYVLLGVIVAIPVWLFRKELIVLISRSDYSGATFFLFLLTFHVVLLSLSGPMGVIARSLGNMKALFWGDALRNGLYMVAAVLLTQRYGPTGMAISFLIATGIGVVYWVVVMRKMGVQVPSIGYLVTLGLWAGGIVWFGETVHPLWALLWVPSLLLPFWLPLSPVQRQRWLQFLHG